MNFTSTRGKDSCSIVEAGLRGLAQDGGLYLPQELPQIRTYLEVSGSKKTLLEAGTEFLSPFFKDVFTDHELREIVSTAFIFDAPLIKLSSGLYILELFHGPTCAFKDFGARFMAQVLSRLAIREKKKLTILVATSGDTGGAVASAFHGVKNTKVTILYPKGRISPMQELQLTTWGDNVQALSVDGSFDDCQRMVKEAFSDPVLTEKYALTSANSINILRLLPQALYYLRAIAQLPSNSPPPLFVVPSGNFGNICAGLIAALSVDIPSKFLAATNANDTVPRYLLTGRYEPKSSLPTLSNAMDVGAPSNFERILHLFKDSQEKLSDRLTATSISDTETIKTIRKVYEEDSYTVCPHTAVGIAAAKKHSMDKAPTVVCATAHPAKFADILKAKAQIEVPLPPLLSSLITRKSRSLEISPSLKALAEVLPPLHS